MSRLTLMLGGALTVWIVLGSVRLSAECVVISSGPAGPARLPKQPEVLQLTGAFCGSAIDETGYPLKNLDLDLLDAAHEDGVVGTLRTDSKGTFNLSGVPAGKYRVSVAAFHKTAEIVEITSADQQKCERPLLVKLFIQQVEECSFYRSHITRMPPSAR
jgi:hypothetical protein